MRIQHNISAFNAHRNLSRTRSSMRKNLEKLSSGYRINRSADDAAGLGVSEKMRVEIAGLKQAENNIQDGISLVQTADGAMQEIHDMLDRMAALSAKSSNGTLSQEERDQIQSEIDALLEEIARIKDTTEFNGIPILQGDEATKNSPPVVLGGLPSWVGITNDNGSLSTNPTDVYQTTEPYKVTIQTTITTAAGSTTTTVRNDLTGSVTVSHATARVDFSNFTGTADQIKDLTSSDAGFYTTCCTCNNHYSIKFVSGSTSKRVSSGSHYIYEVGIDGVTSGSDLVNRIVTVADNGKPLSSSFDPLGHFTRLIADPNNSAQLIVYDDRSFDYNSALTTIENNHKTTTNDPSDTITETFTSLTWPNWDWSDSVNRPFSDRGLFGPGVAYDARSISTGCNVILQIGTSAEEDDRMKIELPNMALSKIGIDGLSVMTTDNAMNAISAVKKGVEYVNAERGRMGAYQNRLEHALKANSSHRENLTASESQIRDADIATEMMTYTKNNILIQSAQSMLAQANQTPQGILQLIQ